MKKKLKITREDLEFFSNFCKENEITFKFKDIEIYADSIYIGSTSHNYLSWDSSKVMTSKDELKIIIGMINSLIDSHELVFKEGK